ncbi:MAG: glycoside hydrolase family 32 protein [Subdoligranulum sp.]|nr:glycoside hydrolase family 32 protein [Subdoligranulum sp.]MBD5101662.1 glycoside hydrolase family 32 protein [Subdoligranulum sp.]
MTSETLQKARDFEAHYGPLIPPEERPAFHATPTIGWMNDPNGFSCYKGEYHLFYQYHPYSNEWGPMHWGHLKTKDFLRWERLPAAIAPDEIYDASGCFSGGALELPDGRQLLMYTGVRRERTPEGLLQDRQTQCIAIGDGVDYEKLDTNPVLAENDLPEGGSAIDFRDPKIWQEADGSYRAVIGNRCPDESGAILLYRSDDAITWTYEATLDASHRQYGLMWECPDFFELDGTQVLFTSPQDMTPIGLEFHAGNGVVCLLGDYNGNTKAFTRRRVQAVDYGIDFYAMQTLLTPDGRRVMIAWMQNWNTVGAKPHGFRWCGQMALPRELHIRDGRLIQTPVRELEQHRGRPVIHHHIPVSGEINLPGVQGRIVDMTIDIEPIGRDSYRCFRLHVAKNGECVTTIRYRPDQSTMKIDRSRSGLHHDIVHTRTFFVRPRDGALRLRVILDRFSVEVFVNDGEQAASAVLYTPLEADAISFEADGTVMMNVEKYDLIFEEEDKAQE